MPSSRERLAGDLTQRLIRASAEDAKIWASAKGANFSRGGGSGGMRKSKRTNKLNPGHVG